jgi:hypothetical protein
MLCLGHLLSIFLSNGVLVHSATEGYSRDFR